MNWDDFKDILKEPIWPGQWTVQDTYDAQRDEIILPPLIYCEYWQGQDLAWAGYTEPHFCWGSDRLPQQLQSLEVDRIDVYGTRYTLDGIDRAMNWHIMSIFIDWKPFRMWGDV